MGRRLRWYDRMRARRRSRLRRLFQGCGRVRLLGAALLAATVLGLVNRYENCHQNHFSNDCLATNAADVISVGNVESFSIVTAAFLYLLDGSRRRQEEHQRQAELVLSSQARGVVVSLARLEALEALCRDGLWFDGQDLSGINLEGLAGAGGRWRGVSFRGSNLEDADFRDADLQGANLSLARLERADLRGADLRGADLRGAVLDGMRWDGALLDGALLDGSVGDSGGGLATLDSSPGANRL
ncbi:MAG: pentapeptide repeat-containing protein [Cyanobacteriota bacterium]|nr:pentapeptide repeat-containing protein [Cyanobacteriota bacterium]